MFLPQTLEEYLDNPMGKGSTAIANRKLIKSDLDARFDKLLAKHKSFKHFHYHDSENFYIHVKIPSESERNNEYDVVIQFTPTEDEVKNDLTLNRYTIKVFSNCPSFTYTYAYVYADCGLMIEFLKDKYEDVVLDDNPIFKNPGEVINFEKSVYFACKFIKANKHFLNKLSLAAISKQLVIERFKKTIKSADAIRLEIKKENNRLAAEKDKATQRDTRKRPDNTGKVSGKPKNTGVTKTRQNHRVTPHKKITGKPKVKSTIQK